MKLFVIILTILSIAMIPISSIYFNLTSTILWSLALVINIATLAILSHIGKMNKEIDWRIAAIRSLSNKDSK